MCTLTQHDPRAVHRGFIQLSLVFGRQLGDFAVPSDLPRIVNVFAVPENVPIWTESGPVLGIWPFLPKYIGSIEQARKEAQGAKTANARAEEMFDKPTWKESALMRRCVIPLSSYVEYQHRGKVKVPYRFHRTDEDCIFVGGIWSTWHGGTTTFAICTMPPNRINAWVHNSKPRQPVILENESEIRQWMTPGGPESIESLLVPRDDDFLATEETEGISGKRVENPPPAPPFD